MGMAGMEAGAQARLITGRGSLRNTNILSAMMAVSPPLSAPAPLATMVMILFSKVRTSFHDAPDIAWNVLVGREARGRRSWHSGQMGRTG